MEVVVVVLGFTTLLTSQVISVAFNIKREKSKTFCSEVQISAWGSFTCHKSTIRDARFYFPSKGSHTQDFYALKKTIDPGRVWTRELGSSVEYDNHGTTRVKGKNSSSSRSRDSSNGKYFIMNTLTEYYQTDTTVFPCLWDMLIKILFSFEIIFSAEKKPFLRTAYGLSTWWLLGVSKLTKPFQVEIATQNAQRTCTGSLPPSLWICERSNHWHEWHVVQWLQNQS